MQHKTSVKMDSPIINGAIVLDLSKRIMHEFYHQFIDNYYKEKASLLLTDTDSFLFLIETENVYEDMKKMGEGENNLFDRSDYPSNHPFFGQYHEDVNHKKFFKFKDENPSSFITDVVFCKPKLYATKAVKHNQEIFNEDGLFEWLEKKKGKGVGRTILDNQLRFDDYMSTVLDAIQLWGSCRGIRSFRHRVCSILQNKRTVNALDVKRNQMSNSPKTYAHGHYLIDEDINTNEN